MWTINPSTVNGVSIKLRVFSLCQVLHITLYLGKWRWRKRMCLDKIINYLYIYIKQHTHCNKIDIEQIIVALIKEPRTCTYIKN